jgi:hypothetical protein
VFWTATYAGGQEASLSVFQGREIGRVGQTKDSRNWQVAWTGADEEGNPVTFGVTKWSLYDSAPLLSVSCRSYRGAPSVVIAITAVEEPPPEPTFEGADDEAGMEGVDFD